MKKSKFNYCTSQKRIDKLKALAVLRSIDANDILDVLIDDHLERTNDILDTKLPIVEDEIMINVKYRIKA